MSCRINFFKAKKAAKNRFVYILYMNLNNVGTSQARIEDTFKSGLTSEEVKMSPARKEKR